MEKILISALALSFAITVSAQGADQKPIRIPLHASKVSLDPTGVQDSPSLWVSRQLNCQLVRMNGRDTVLDAAKDVQYLSPTQIRITLKDGIRFQDGRPVSAEDVVATFDFLKSSRKVLRNVFTWIREVKAENSKTVRIELTQAVPQFLKFLGAPNYAIFPKDFLARAKNDPSAWSAPIGCGGYRVESKNTEAGSIRLTPVSIGRPIEFIFAEGRSLSPEQFSNFDLIDAPLSDRLGVPSGFKEVGLFDPKQVFIGLNTQLPQWKKKEDRCQFLSRIQAPAILGAYQGKAEAASSLFPRGVLGYRKENSFELPGKNGNEPSFASACIAFLGLSVPTDLRPAYLDSAKAAAKNLRSVVIDDPKAFGPSFLKSGCDALVIGLKSNYLDGYEFLLSVAEPTANFTGFKDAELERSIKDSQKISDSGQRAQLYQVMEARIKDECMMRPLITIPLRKVLVKRDLKTPGIGEVPINEYYLGGIE